MTRTFIRKWIFFFTVVIYISFIALRVSPALYHIFFWFLMCFALTSFLSLVPGYFFARLHLERKVTRRMEEDDVSEAEIFVENIGFWPAFNLVIEDRLSYATPTERDQRVLVSLLWPGSSLSFKCRVWCPQRGKHTAGPFAVYFFDPWGLFFLKKTYPIYSEVYVYPRTCKIQKFPAMAKGISPWFGIQTGRTSGDEHEFYGVREYVPGDPIKRIHWLSTARKNRLIIRQFQEMLFYRVTILFNLEKNRNYGIGKESVAEYMIKIAASLARHFIERGVSVSVAAHAEEMARIPFNKGPEHLEDILKLLATAQPESKTGLLDLFEEFADTIPSDSSLVVIMLDTDWEILSTMLSIENRNIYLIPLILISSSFLNQTDKHVAIKDVKRRLPEQFSSPPVFFACGEPLEEPFLA